MNRRNKEDRDEKGRFTKGNAGGPGRPKKIFGDGLLRDLAKPIGGTMLELTADTLSDQEQAMERIRERHGPKVIQKIERLIMLSELAQNYMITELVKGVRGE